MAYYNGKKILSVNTVGAGGDVANNYSIAYNLVVNRNGYQFNGYKFADVTITGFEDYTIKQFQVSSTSVKVTDLSVIKSYLSVITGHDRVPMFDEDKPCDEFVICSANDTIWKLQYDETNGLLAFLVEDVPYFSTKLYVHTITSGNTIVKFVSKKNSLLEWDDVYSGYQLPQLILCVNIWIDGYSYYGIPQDVTTGHDRNSFFLKSVLYYSNTNVWSKIMFNGNETISIDEL